MTDRDERSKLVHLMEGRHTPLRALVGAVLLAAAFTLSAAPPQASCGSPQSGLRMAGEGKQPENRSTHDRCKRADGARITPVPKGCPDGGERLPQENNKRSPADEAPPLSPLVA